MPKPYTLLAIAGISAFLALVAFYLPWMRFEINPDSLENPALQNECTQWPPGRRPIRSGYGSEYRAD